MHSERLGELAAIARTASSRGDVGAELAAWREALELLPTDSRQHAVVAATVQKLSERAGGGSPAARTGPGGAPHSAGKKAAAGLGAAGLLLWKFKVFALLLLTKGKFLLLGLTKASTFFSMLLSLGVYWTAFGWKFALGLVLSIYIHEMGHVVMLRKYGFKATGPLFLPGLGAVILLKQQPANPREDAAIGLAGPIYGLGAAAAALLLWYLTGKPIFGAIGTIGAWINLFNLLPVWTLDGGRAFRVFSRSEKWIAAAAAGAAYLVAPDGMLLLLLIVVAGRALAGREHGPGDRRAITQYVLLTVTLSLICVLRKTVSHTL